MTDEDRQFLKDVIDQEGFDYTFLHFSSFKNIKDETLQNLIAKFKESARELALYIGVENY